MLLVFVHVTEAPRDFFGFRDKPNGVVLLDEANVRLRDEKSARPFTFVLSHAGGESVVLAAESEKEMHECEVAMLEREARLLPGPLETVTTDIRAARVTWDRCAGGCRQ